MLKFCKSAVPEKGSSQWGCPIGMIPVPKYSILKEDSDLLVILRGERICGTGSICFIYLKKRVKVKRKKLAFLILLSAFLGACCPGGRTPASGQDDRIPSAESIIARMRADTLWIKHLETLADSAVGPGARCIDPVWHLFEWEGRNWFFNQDFASKPPDSLEAAGHPDL